MKNDTVVYRLDKNGYRIPLFTADSAVILSPEKFENSEDIFGKYKKERLFALYQGQAFLIWERN